MKKIREMLSNKNNYKYILSFVLIIVLFVMVGGISYAMFDYSRTGTKENVITTGEIRVAFAEQNNIKLQNRYAETDTQGLANTDPNSRMTFTISSDITGEATVNYAVGLVDIVEGATLTQEYVKIYLEKNGSVASGFTNGEGILIKDFKSLYVDEYLDSYVIAQGSVTGTQTDTYTLKAWIDENYDLPTTDTSSGNVHSNQTASETFSFKIKVIGTDNIISLKELTCDEMPAETANVNIPSLATNMIPVCYNSTKDVWLKADSTNTDSDYRWYSYSGKTWANAVTVGNKYERTLKEENKTVNIANEVDNPTVYTSGNKGIASSTSAATFTFTAGTTGTYSFDWNVSSYGISGGKLEVIVNGSSVLSNKYNNQSGTYTGNVTSGTTYTIVAIYTKGYTTSTSSSYTDTAYLANFKLPEGTTDFTHTVNAKYPWTTSNDIDYHSIKTYTNYTKDSGVFKLSNDVVKGDITGKYICSDGTSKACDEMYEIVEYTDTAITKVNSYVVEETEDVRTKYLESPVGTPIAMSDINTMLVWIPRFSATGDTANYNGGTQDAPGAFNITFVDKATAAHDAFDFGGAISGFWIGKFENSSDTTCVPDYYSAVGEEGCNLTTIRPKVLPNATTWRGADLSTFFYDMQNMVDSGNQYGFDKTKDTTLDTHVLKNNEWGAVAYLTQSIYGRCSSSTSCTEVRMNSKSYITGYSAPAGSSTLLGNSTYVEPQPYNTEQGMDASTTGNIYGVYDMSGGALEYVMGNYNNRNVGFTTLPNTKYYNVYTSESAYRTSGLQHALTETKNWYDDRGYFAGSNNPWFIRGGRYYDESSAGVFYFDYSTATSDPEDGSRVSATIN